MQRLVRSAVPAAAELAALRAEVAALGQHLPAAGGAGGALDSSLTPSPSFAPHAGRRREMASPLILVASATATTGSQAVAALSRAGARVRAFVRKLDDPRAKALAALPGVELVAGDFDDAKSVAAALAGVQRALLVSGAFAYEQFERETLFIEAAAAAGLEVTVRIGTASALVKPGTKGAYGRAHHGIDAFIASMGYKVVTLNPNW